MIDRNKSKNNRSIFKSSYEEVKKILDNRVKMKSNKKKGVN